MSIYVGNPKLKTAATERPVSYGEAKEHLRIFHDDEKTLIESLIKAATNYCQDIQNRAYVTQTWELTFDRFPADDTPIYLPRAPLKTLNSIKYNDTADGTQQTWGSALWDSVTRAVPGYIVPAYGESYPSARLHPESIVVDYDAGFGAASAVPEEVKSMIKLLLTHLYRNREMAVEKQLKQVPQSFNALLWHDRVF